MGATVNILNGEIILSPTTSTGGGGGSSIQNPVTEDLTFSSNNGIILEAPNGNKYKITVSDAGALITTLVTP